MGTGYKMNTIELLDIISSGETSKVQFKRELGHKDQIASEMIAMSNAKGGIIIFGIEDKTGDIVGLDYGTIQSLGEKISDIANDSVNPSIYVTTEVISISIGAELKKILIVYIDEGLSKPYKDNNGSMWVKQGANKRRVTDTNEQIRLIAKSGFIYVDEIVVADTDIDCIDKNKVEDYIKLSHLKINENTFIQDDILYRNLSIIKDSKLTIGGLLFFGKEPQRYKPAFCIKAVSFIGNSIGGSSYKDSREITGTIPSQFAQSMLFFKQNLKYLQNGQNFNKPGILEISEIALEELLQNALIHRDYSKNAPIRLMIFDDRIEIVSPGCLPNSLSIDSIMVGNAVVRNNLITSYCSKLMNYKGFGSGIIRSINEQPNIEFINDVEGELFTVKIPREKIETVN